MEETKEMPDLLQMSLYDSLELKDFSPEQIIQILFFHENIMDEYTIPSIDCFCSKCEKSTTFKSRNSVIDSFEKVIAKSKSCEWYERGSEHWFFNYDSFLPILQEIEFFHRSFYCPRFPKDNTHDITIVLRVTEDKLTKIGQFPSIASIENSHHKKYKKLNSDIYKELNTASGLNSHGVGVGAFVYLRRIIEKHIVYPVIEELIENGALQPEQISNFDFKQKVNIVKSKLPVVLTENVSLYSILSKGIHSLSEEECLKFFPSLLTAIELILDERVEELNKEEKKKKLKSALGEISREI